MADPPEIRARAPGRLDVMGGIADYSGSLVLELPLDRFITATLKGRGGQGTKGRRDEGTNGRMIDVRSRRAGGVESFAMELGGPVPREPAWAPYVAGVIDWCFQRIRPLAPSPLRPFALSIESNLPEGKGVASSAALEVACMKAITEFWGIALEPAELAAACQWVENAVVGAPCGIMDQMTAACGQRGKLLRLLCQPAIIESHVEIPTGYRFFGIDSGIRHAVTGADYGTVRTAAFMGLRIISEMDPRAVPGGYLANLGSERFARFEKLLPDRMSGADFLQLHSGLGDPAGAIVRDRLYPVCQATRHPVMEHQRVQRFAALLGELSARRDAAEELGGLMLASHESYSACGLGSDGTDRLVAMVMQAGPRAGLFGAKITGGGSGGTVVVFGTAAAAPVVADIAARYNKETGRMAEVI